MLLSFEMRLFMIALRATGAFSNLVTAVHIWFLFITPFAAAPGTACYEYCKCSPLTWMSGQSWQAPKSCFNSDLAKEPYYGCHVVAGGAVAVFLLFGLVCVWATGAEYLQLRRGKGLFEPDVVTVATLTWSILLINLTLLVIILCVTLYSYGCGLLVEQLRYSFLLVIFPIIWLVISGIPRLESIEPPPDEEEPLTEYGRFKARIRPRLLGPRRPRVAEATGTSGEHLNRERTRSGASRKPTDDIPMLVREPVRKSSRETAFLTQLREEYTKSKGKSAETEPSGTAPLTEPEDLEIDEGFSRGGRSERALGRSPMSPAPFSRGLRTSQLRQEDVAGPSPPGIVVPYSKQVVSAMVEARKPPPSLSIEPCRTSPSSKPAQDDKGVHREAKGRKVGLFGKKTGLPYGAAQKKEKEAEPPEEISEDPGSNGPSS